jgi:hypothetical protein
VCSDSAIPDGNFTKQGTGSRLGWRVIYDNDEEYSNFLERHSVFSFPDERSWCFQYNGLCLRNAYSVALTPSRFIPFARIDSPPPDYSCRIRQVGQKIPRAVFRRYNDAAAKPPETEDKVVLSGDATASIIRRLLDCAARCAVKGTGKRCCAFPPYVAPACPPEGRGVRPEDRKSSRR